MHSCYDFDKKRKKFVVEKRKQGDSRPLEKIQLDFFLEHFSIMQKNFVSKNQRTKTEAFLIKVHKPELNEQVHNLSFKLF